MKVVGKVVGVALCGVALYGFVCQQWRQWSRWRAEQRFYLGLRDSLLRFQQNIIGEHE